jgi:hypothetical protein
MLHTSTQKLILKLCALTESGDIAWREGEGSAVVFETEGYRVEVQGEPPSVRLLRNDGKELETASTVDLASTRWPDGEGTFATRVSEMARLAQRAARGADFAISRILSSLSAPPQKTPEPVLAPPMAEAANTPEPPPSPHTIPEPPLQSPHTSTAVGKLFAVNPAPAPADAIESAPVEPEAEEVIEAAEEELPLEDAPEPARVEPEPIEQPPPPLPEPQYKQPVFAAPEPPPSYAPVSQGFGAIRSFVTPRPPKPKPAPVPPPPAAPEPVRAEPPIEPKVTSTGLFITGISAMTRQTVGREPPPERAAPPPAPTVQAPPAPEPRREPAPASGPDIYKPWV